MNSWLARMRRELSRRSKPHRYPIVFLLQGSKRITVAVE